MNKLKQFFLPALVVLAAIFAAIKFFIAPKKDDVPFPNSEEKKKAEAEIAGTRKEIDELKDKVYTDKEINEKFNR